MNANTVDNHYHRRRHYDDREFKQRRRQRQRQRQRHKTIGLTNKNNRSARAFYILGHFFAVFCKKTT